MKKLRADSHFNGLTMEQREKLLNWLFNEGLSYRVVVRRMKEEMGREVSLAAVGRYYRHVAEDRLPGDLVLKDGTTNEFRMAARKLLGAAAMNACLNHHNDREGDGWKPVVALMKLMQKDQDQELKEQKMIFDLQRLKSLG